MPAVQQRVKQPFAPEIIAELAWNSLNFKWKYVFYVYEQNVH